MISSSQDLAKMIINVRSMGQSDLEKLRRDYNRFLKGRTQTTDLAKWRATTKRRVGSPGTALGTSMAGRRTRGKGGVEAG